jgi:hypothetical protein
VRAGCKPSAAGQEMIGIAREGPVDRQTIEQLWAMVSVARKLASSLRRMWVSETDSHVGLGAKVTQRLRLKRLTDVRSTIRATGPCGGYEWPARWFVVQRD